jgi:hypothetical protein
MSDESSLTAAYRAQLPSLASLSGLLDQILDLEGHESFKALDPVAQPQFAYIRDHVFAIARLLKHRLSTTDPLLLSGGGLTNLSNQMPSVLNEFRNFAANKNHGHLSNAGANLDGAIFPLLWAMFPENGTGPLDSAQLGLVRTVQERANEAIKAVVEAQDAAMAASQEKLSKAIEALTSTESEALKGFAANGVDLQSRMVKASDEVTALTQQIAQQRAENAAVIAKLEKEFSEDQQKRGERFTSLLEKQADDYASRSKAADDDAGALLRRLSAHEQEVAKLVEAIGTKGITANYAAIADRELKSANRWRSATVSFFVLGIGIAAYIFFKVLPASLDHLNLGEIALRFGFALAVTAPAIYTARESARHRTTGDRATQAQMELASLGPFIANLDRDSQDSIRRDLVDKYFGREHEVHSAEPPIKLKDVGNLAVELVKASREVAEKKK